MRGLPPFAASRPSYVTICRLNRHRPEVPGKIKLCGQQGVERGNGGSLTIIIQNFRSHWDLGSGMG